MDYHIRFVVEIEPVGPMSYARAEAQTRLTVRSHAVPAESAAGLARLAESAALAARDAVHEEGVGRWRSFVAGESARLLALPDGARHAELARLRDADPPLFQAVSAANGQARKAREAAAKDEALARFRATFVPPPTPPGPAMTAPSPTLGDCALKADAAARAGREALERAIAAIKAVSDLRAPEWDGTVGALYGLTHAIDDLRTTLGVVDAAAAKAGA